MRNVADECQNDRMPRTNGFGKVGQYGPLIDTPFNAGGHNVGHGYYDFRQILANNPCT